MNRGHGFTYNQLVRFVVVALLVVLGVTPAASEPARKPSAPVRVYLESKPIAGGYEVRLIAIPTRDVPALELDLAGKSVSYGPTTAGQRREFVTRVAVRGGDGLDVVGSARVESRSKAIVKRVGTARSQAPKRPTTIRTLPDGRQIQEVR